MLFDYNIKSMSLPLMGSPDYFMVPSLKDLATMELSDPGYCFRVKDFTVGRFGYGHVRFFGETNVQWLDLDKIVNFRKHEIVVYDEQCVKPMIGQGLNKAAEVTLILHSYSNLKEQEENRVREKLKLTTMQQGASFISFNSSNGEWKFSVSHFSRFGLSEDDEDDITMDDANVIQQPEELEENAALCEVSDMDTNETVLSHSLPTHLPLDPEIFKEQRMLMFPVIEKKVEDFDGVALGEEHIRKTPMQHFTRRVYPRSSPPIARKSPLPLIEYNPCSLDLVSPSTNSIVFSQQNKRPLLKNVGAGGFKLDLTHETIITPNYSRNIVDAGLFLGRSFRVGWGPNGILVHSGSTVGNNDRVLSSVIKLEKVAFDTIVRDENNKVREELIEFCFESPLKLHQSIDYEELDVEVGSFKLRLQKRVSKRLVLSDICRSYIDIVERQMEVPGLSSFAEVILIHQVMVWELIKVLFSVRGFLTSEHSKFLPNDSEDDMMHEDMMHESDDLDIEALPLVRRAEFSLWLQDSVCHRVQDDLSFLCDSSDLRHIFLSLTGRQLDEAVEIASSRGDVRLACLLSQAGGSMVNRSDFAQQLEQWKNNGLDFNFIEEERVRIFELLAGNIHAASHGIKLDWKRFLGLLMWYQLSPTTSLPSLFNTYKKLLNEEMVPCPVPVYIDEGPIEEDKNCRVEKDGFDLSFYLMLLHGSEGRECDFIKSMFSSISSTCDPLDYHMIWHQCAILQSIGAFRYDDLQVLDMGMISQLLCLGKPHWAIYVVLHMPYREDFPYLQASLIKEILFRYCEIWCTQESQQQFIENLDVPSAWLHEAMAVYYNYCGDLMKAIEHFIQCSNWQKAHSIFITSVAHSLYLSARHSEIQMFIVSMEEHKSEIEHWDLGAGVYASFYLLISFLEDDDSNTSVSKQEDSIESKIGACGNFFGLLNESLCILSSCLPTDARVAYSKMAEEICGLLGDARRCCGEAEIHLRCLDTVIRPPLPKDHQSVHLQDALSIFTNFICDPSHY